MFYTWARIMNNHSSASIHTSLVLPYGQCTIISPRYKYKKNEETFKHEKIERKLGNLALLEATISSAMIDSHKKHLVETLSDTKPIIYLDCSHKWDKDILFFMMEQLIEKYPWEETNGIIKDVITTTSMIDESVRKKISHTDWNFLSRYYEAFATELTKYDNDNAKNSLINFEIDVPLAIMSEILEEKGKYAYMYLDNIAFLTMEEQQRINRLLYARGWIDHLGHCSLYLKINNWSSWRKTRFTSYGQKIEAPHDYSETTLAEEDLSD